MGEVNSSVFSGGGLRDFVCIRGGGGGGKELPYDMGTQERKLERDTGVSEFKKKTRMSGRKKYFILEKNEVSPTGGSFGLEPGGTR